MLARAAKSDGKYGKLVTVFLTLVLSMSGLVLSPAHATAPIDGDYVCTTGDLKTTEETPTYTITSGVVTNGGSCAGAVVIPVGVTSIGIESFAYATSLTSITIPASVTSILNNAFYGSALASIAIPASVTSIGDDAFQNTRSLASITVDDANANYSAAAGVLFNKDATTLWWYPRGKPDISYTIPASVTTIKNYAFAYVITLTSVTIPASVTTIGQSAFLSASSLTSVYFLGNAPTTVGSMQFYLVASGAKAYIKSGNTSFGSAGASWNDLVVDIFAPDGAYVCTTGEPLEASSSTSNFTITSGVVTDGWACEGAVVIPEGVTSIGDWAFEGSALTSIAIPASYTSIGEYAFGGAYALTSITVADANPNYSSVDGVLFNKDATTLISYPVGKTETSYAIPASVTSIGVSAFVDATALTSITVPTSVTSIGVSAFYGATALTSITVDGANPNYSSVAGVLFDKLSTTLVAYPAGKTGTSYTIPASVTSIGVYAFTVARILTSVTIPASVTSIGGGAFQDAAALTSITVADANLNYSSDAGVLFNKDATTLIIYPVGKTGTSYTVPASVTSISDAAFRNATSLKTVTFGTGSQLTSIGEYAFSLARSLTSITIPASVTSIGEYAFAFARSLTSITIPAGVTSIGEFTFGYARSLTSITIPAGVTSIGVSAFAGTFALTSVYFLGNAPTNVGEYAFYSVASGAKAYIRSEATDFAEADADWNGLIVTVGFYTVTYNTSGGSAVTAQNYGANIATPTSPTRTGYTFAGWSRSSGGSVITFPHTPALAGDITLYAKWNQNPVRAQATVKPTVSGTAKVSKTLTANKGTWTGYPTPVITYQWYSCTKQVNAATQTIPSTCKSVSKATKSTLAVTSSFKGKYLAVTVTGTSTGTSATKWLSKSTTIVK